MSTLHLLLSEIRYRLLNFVLSLLAIAAAATLFVAGPMLIASYSQETNRLVGEKKEELGQQLDAQRTEQQGKLAAMQQETDVLLADMDKQTKRLMRDLGFNLMIVHRDTEMIDFYSEFKAADMPQEYVQRLASSPTLDKIRHLVATLQQKITWNDRKVLLVGIAPETVQSHLDDKAPMGYVIKTGTVILGHEVGVGRAAGEMIDVLGRQYVIEKILPEHGTHEDIMIAMNLGDAQTALDKPEIINQIMALGCKCKIDRLAEVREQLEAVLPEAKVTEHRTRAIARAEQRKLVGAQSSAILAQEAASAEQLNQQTEANNAAVVASLEQQRTAVQRSLQSLVMVTTPLVVLICAVWVGLLAWANVRERRPEIGILRALGKRSSAIASLFLGKAILMGLLGGLIGCGLGYLLAVNLGTDAIETAGLLLAVTLIGSPLIAAMATYLPALVAIRQDPAVVLRDQ